MGNMVLKVKNMQCMNHACDGNLCDAFGLNMEHGIPVINSGINM